MESNTGQEKEPSHHCSRCGRHVRPRFVITLTGGYVGPVCRRKLIEGGVLEPGDVTDVRPK